MHDRHRGGIAVLTPPCPASVIPAKAPVMPARAKRPLDLLVFVEVLDVLGKIGAALLEFVDRALG